MTQVDWKIVLRALKNFILLELSYVQQTKGICLEENGISIRGCI